MELIALGLFLLLLYGGVRLLASARLGRHRRPASLVPPACPAVPRPVREPRPGRSPHRQLQPQWLDRARRPRSCRARPACAPSHPGRRPLSRRPPLPARADALRPPLAPPAPQGHPPRPHGHRPNSTAPTPSRPTTPTWPANFSSPPPCATPSPFLNAHRPLNGFLLSINPERLLVQVDRNVAVSTQNLSTLVRETLVLLDSLQSSVAAKLSHGIEVVPTDPATAQSERLGPPECQICGTEIEGSHVECDSCSAPFHRDCWSFVGGCATFGCTGKKCHSA